MVVVVFSAVVVVKVVVVMVVVVVVAVGVTAFVRLAFVIFEGATLVKVVGCWCWC